MSLDELKDVRPPVDLPVNYFWLIVVLIFAAIVGLVYMWRWLKTRLPGKLSSTAVARPAWEIAREELRLLEQDDLSGLGQVEQYFVRLSSIIRRYLERRFLISAPEMTTDEFLFNVDKMAALDQRQKLSLKEFLNLSDMVKFARYMSSVNEMKEAFVAAQRFIDETIPNIENTQSPQ